MDFSNPTDNTLIVTPNQRLAASLRQEHEQQTAHRTTINYHIRPFKQWLQSLWQLYSPFDFRYLLNPHHEIYLWQNIIQTSRTGEDLIDVHATAKSVKQAWDLCHEWMIDINDTALANNENAASFQQWAAQFERHCNDNQLITASQAEMALITHINQLAPLLPKTVIFYHFLELTPSQQQLISALKQQRINVIIHSAPSNHQSASLVACHDKHNEYHAMVQFALQTHHQHPSAIIGCIVPDLHSDRDAIERCFNQAFATNDAPVDYSAGKPLSHYPIIRTLMTLFRLLTSDNQLERLSELILSPFIAEAEQHMNTRHLLDALLRQRHHHTVSIAQTLQQLRHHPQTAQHLDAAIEQLLEQLIHIDNQTIQSPQKTVAMLQQLLHHIGWPGERLLTSEEHQLVNKLLECLDQLAQFGPVTGDISIKSALHLLMDQLNATVFQIEKTKTNIQVLGTLEASGMQFDYAWVCGYNDTSMPTPPKANPFIPNELQVKHNLPHGTAEREYEFCKTLTNGFIAHNRQVYFSYAQQDNGNTQRVSLLVSHLQHHTAPGVKAEKTRPENQLSPLTEDTAPPYTKARIPGGADTLRRQSICPFQAFATYRLQANPIETNPLGVTPRHKGTVTHKALELLWHQLQSQQQLLSLTEQQQHELITDCVQSALKQQLTNANYSTAILSLEQQRLTTLLKDWLNQERAREPFTIAQLEKTSQYHHAGFSLTMTIDRIDQDPQGKRTIIDYKTGNTNIKDWFGHRMKQPQLPLYLISHPTPPPSTMAFATIKRNANAYYGVANEHDDAPPFKSIASVNYPNSCDHWQQQIQLWAQQINLLIDAFAAGEAAVNPIDASVCQHCELNPLCRIMEHE